MPPWRQAPERTGRCGAGGDRHAGPRRARGMRTSHRSWTSACPSGPADQGSSCAAGRAGPAATDTPGETMMQDLDAWLDRHHDELTAIRRDIHAHPELGMEEHRTSALVAGKLRDWGIDYAD